MKTRGTIFNFDDRPRVAEMLSRLGNRRGLWEISVQPHKPRRSLKANAYFWAAVVPAFQGFMRSHGQFYEKEEVYEFFLQKFAGRPVVDPNTGEVLDVIGCRSSKMNSQQFAEFVSNCVEWMIDRFGIIVPEPEMMKV